MRTVTLVLADDSGTPLGAMAPFEVESPWWQEVGEFPPGVTVLRLLHADRPAMPGGHVTYLATAEPPLPPLTPVDLKINPEPRRLVYALPGGPQASLTWAFDVLGGPLPARQKRTWNLSSIWRLGPADSPVAWLKQVPPFFGHEAAAIRLVDSVAPGLVPPLLAAGPHGRLLLAHVPGSDRYGADLEICSAIAAAFHTVQSSLTVPDGASLTVPDGASLAVSGLGAIPDGRSIDFGRVAAPYYASIPGLGAVIDGLPARLAALAACGLPDTLVHGDLHPGNTRVDEAGRLTVMDWGDCFVGNPAYDILRLTEHLPDPAPLLAAWAARWRASVPGCDPQRAAELIRPVAALRSAVVYQNFLDNIEPSEHPYHALDVPQCLSAAVAATSA